MISSIEKVQSDISIKNIIMSAKIRYLMSARHHKMNSNSENVSQISDMKSSSVTITQISNQTPIQFFLQSAHRSPQWSYYYKSYLFMIDQNSLKKNGYIFVLNLTQIFYCAFDDRVELLFIGKNLLLLYLYRQKQEGME